MPNWLSILLILTLLYSPFLFIILVPRGLVLGRVKFDDIQYSLCTQLKDTVHVDPSLIFTACKEKTTLAVIKPDGMEYEKEIVDILTENGFSIKHDKTIQLSTDKVHEWYADKQDASYFNDLVNYLTRDKIRVLELSRINAVHRLRQIIGPTNSKVAKQLFPKSIRALYGKDVQENAIHASDSEDSVKRELNILFDKDETIIVNTRHL